MSMKVKLWGVRGSLPAPRTPEQISAKLKRFAAAVATAKISEDQVTDFINDNYDECEVGGFGGHTACIQVMSDTQSLIVDGGSGLRGLGEQLMCGPCGLGRGEVHILYTHFHWDHLIGLPFFSPIFTPGNQIHFHAVQPELEEVICSVFRLSLIHI